MDWLMGKEVVFCNAFAAVSGGDGFDVMPDAEDPRWVYINIKDSLSRYNIAIRLERPVPPNKNNTVNVLIECYAQDPFNKATIYYRMVFKQDTLKELHAGANIPDLTTNDSAKSINLIMEVFLLIGNQLRTIIPLLVL